MIKRFLLSLMAVCVVVSASAHEGMWLPMLIGKNMDSMRAEGCHLTAKDIYDANHASLKDAVVLFGGGCTGAIISPEGLLITNHHCGYASIAALSTLDHDYLKDGFWAKSKKQELPVKGLTVKLLVRMQDVTADFAKAERKNNEKKRRREFEKIEKKIIEEASENGKYVAVVKPIFSGNQYLLMVYQVFKDIRLVAAPPKALGKFGGNTDNWMWPRHTCDFSMFRIYADSNNFPAEYSVKNVPYHPKKFFTISLKGFQPDAFAMVMGYPAITHRYETSYGVQMALNITDPSIVKIRDLRLSIMRQAMKNDPEVSLELSSEYARIANYWKYYIGQSEQLKRLHVVTEKQKQEQAFSKWAADNDHAESKLMSEFGKCYAAYRPYAKQNVYYIEAFGASRLARIAASTHALYKALSAKHPKKEDIQNGLIRLKEARAEYMEHFVPNMERKMFAKMAELYYEEVPRSQLPRVYNDFIFRQFKGDSLAADFRDFATYTFSHTFLLDKARFAAFCAHPTLDVLKNDPAVTYALSFVNKYNETCLLKVADFRAAKAKLEKRYIAGLMEMHPRKRFYPDANGTMRVTFGQIKGYSPEDGVYYSDHTTLKGLLAKYQPHNPEFDLPSDFLALAKKKQFGKYANGVGGLTTCFIANTDITGGNSGSPVINADGHLIGLAFDGNWEAMSGAIAFDKKYKRTIAVDIRFILWVTAKYGHDQNLINEMRFAD